MYRGLTWLVSLWISLTLSECVDTARPRAAGGAEVSVAPCSEPSSICGVYSLAMKNLVTDNAARVLVAHMHGACIAQSARPWLLLACWSCT